MVTGSSTSQWLRPTPGSYILALQLGLLLQVYVRVFQYNFKAYFFLIFSFSVTGVVTAKASASKKKATPKKAKAETTPAETVAADQKPSTSSSLTATALVDKMHKDNSFREYRRLCADIANASSYLTKTAIVRNFFNKGTKGGQYSLCLRSPLLILF